MRPVHLHFLRWDLCCKEFFIWLQLFPIGINWINWLPTAHNWQKFWPLKIQEYLIFMLRHAHLYFLSAIFDNKRVKIFFQWDSMDSLRPNDTHWTQWLANEKKFRSSETQINLISRLRYADLHFLCAILDDNRAKNFFNDIQWDSMRPKWYSIELNDKPMKKNIGP